jgi:hypothetical protein
MSSDNYLRAHRATHTKTNSWWLRDAKGIELARVCDECIDEVKSQYAPEVLGELGRYEDVVDEQIEDDY